MPCPAAIAIDGPVASGKTVIGRLLAQRLGYRFLDTGVMYRAATWAAIERGVDLEDWEGLSRLAESLDMRLVPGEPSDRLLVDSQDVTDHLRSPHVEKGVSLVASVPGVRSALVRQQRHIAQEGPIVMIGRDIGTVVLPEAEVKVFLNASVDVRAQRRHQEMVEKGVPSDVDEVKADLIRRDRIDSQRSDSPLRPAEDAVQIGTDDMTIEEVAGSILSLVESVD